MFFAGLAQGINQGLTQSRQEEAARAEHERTRENAILMHLSTSDDPDIASMALAGLTDQAAGRKPTKGLRGWMGEMQGNPALPSLRQLMQAGKQVTQQTEPAPGRLPEGGAALPAGSPVEPGGPPMSLEAVHNALPQAAGASVTRTVPRAAFLPPGEKARLLEEGREGGKLSALRTGVQQARTPEERAMMLAQGGVHPSTALHFVPGTAPGKALLASDPTARDIDGVPIRAEGFYRTQIVVDPITGVQTPHHIPTTGPAAARPTGLAAQAIARAQEIVAEHEAKGLPPLEPEAALQQAQVEMRTQRIATATQQGTLSAARVASLNAATTRAQQLITGNVPATLIQATAAARQALGNGPEVEEGDIDIVAARIMAQSRSGGKGPPAPPPTTTPTATTPSTTPAPPAAPSIGIFPADMAARLRTPRLYSPQGKRTVQAIETAKPMLEQLIADIKGAGLENDNNAMGTTGFDALFQRRGFSPGQLQTELLQLASMSEAAQMSAIASGRLTIPVLNILKGHLTDAGDSYKLLYDKANGLLGQLPKIQAAVDKAENIQVGRRGRNPASPPGVQAPSGNQPVYAWDPQGIRHVQTDPTATLPAGWTATPPRK